MYDYEESLKRIGQEIRNGNPSPGNIAGGLTTLEEKSLGCIHKGGKSTINAVYDYAEQLKTGEGLIIMDTPSNDAASVAGLIAGRMPGLLCLQLVLEHHWKCSSTGYENYSK